MTRARRVGAAIDLAVYLNRDRSVTRRVMHAARVSEGDCGWDLRSVWRGGEPPPRRSPHAVPGFDTELSPSELERLAFLTEETMNLATWNIREFGRQKRQEKSLHYITEVIGRFDLVALTEVRRDLSELLRVTELLPPFWDFVTSDYGGDRAANKERIAYVFDKRVVRFTGLAA